jgi:hypothetical protein
MNKQEITRRALELKIRELKGAKIATIVSETVPAMRKTDNPFHGRIRKVSRTNVVLNCVYQNSVNNQREREDLERNFEPEPRKWGQRIVGTGLVEHNGELYLETKIQRTLGYTYIDQSGSEVDPAIINPYLPKRVEGERQGVEKPVIWRDYKLASIRELVVDGTTFVVV